MMEIVKTQKSAFLTPSPSIAIIIYPKDAKYLSTKMPTASDFQLIDDQHNAVEYGEMYSLMLANPDLEGDGLSLEILDHLHGTNGHGDPILTCELINGITYLKYGYEFLYIRSDDLMDTKEIGLTDHLPKKHERLRLVVSDEDNTFQISTWDQDAFATLEWIKCSYAALSFQGSRTRGVKLFFSPV